MKGVIFDFNGTLFLDNDKHVKAWSQVAKALRGYGISEQELHTRMNGVPNVQVVRYLNGGKEDPVLEEKWSAKKEEFYRQYCKEDSENFHLIAGAKELFDALKAKGIPFTIASASIKDNIDFFVESFGLDAWIDPADIVYDDGSFENKAAMFEKAASILHVPLTEMTIIEDSLAGMQAAVDTGVQDIRIINSGHIADTVKSFHQVRQVMSTLEEIDLPA